VQGWGLEHQTSQKGFDGNGPAHGFLSAMIMQAFYREENRSDFGFKWIFKD
jgi:hypothetical protein